jgi:hypothetical protein
MLAEYRTMTMGTEVQQQLRPTNQGNPNPPAECYASVPRDVAADEALLDLTSLRATLIRNQRRSLMRLRAVRLVVYALGAVGWIALIGNLLWVAAKTPVR